MDDIADKKKEREESIAALTAALAGIEGGKGLPERFAGGHGFMSRRFVFEWIEPMLEIRFDLPYARVLSSEEAQQEDASEIAAAIRMAILLLTAEGRRSGTEDLRVNVWADDDGVGYSVLDGEGNAVDAGDDWSGLVHRLEAALPKVGESLAVIWP